MAHAPCDARPPSSPTCPPPTDDEAFKHSAQIFVSYDRSQNVNRESKLGRASPGPGQRLYPSWPALADIHFIDSSSGSEEDGSECGRRRRGEGACEGGQEAGGEDVVLIHDEVCAAEKGSTSATVGGGEHAAASRRSCCHDGGRAAVVSAGGSGVCMMKHKGGPLVIAQDHGDHDKPHASMAASDAALQQQPSGSTTTMVTTTGGGGGAPLRSALKRAGQKSRGHRVCINEAKNECLEADYVIVVHEESEPQLVSIRAFDLSLAPAAPGVEQLTLSPPEGYKDCFTHAVHETIVDDSETDAGGDGLVEADAPRPHLPDLVTHRSPPTQLTVENVRHHDQLMQGREQDPSDPKVAKTGILKGGKLWKNGDGRKTKVRVEEEEAEEPRRSVRFSGRDEYSLLESLPLDKIPLDAPNSVALARFMPKLRELGVLLGEPRHDWHLELSPIKPEAEGGAGAAEQEGLPEDKEKQPPPQMDDEQIKESMQRYDEMRRRIAAAEGRDNTSVCSDESKSSSDSQSSDSTMTETRIRRLENADVAHVAGGVMRTNSEVRRAIERNALRRSLIRFSEARKKDTNKNDKNDKGETSLLEKLKWLTASEDATNGNSEQKEEGMEEPNDEEDDGSQDLSKSMDPKVQETIAQYRKLAEMFNKTTSLRTTDILVPGDVREWKLKADLFPSQARAVLEAEEEEVPEPHSGSTTPTVYQGIIPAVSLADLMTDEETDKLIYSGGVRYTREGTLPLEAQGEGEEAEGEQQQPPTTSTAEARKQFLSQMASQAGTPHVSANGVTTLPGDRSSLASNSDSYTFEDIDEALHDDRSSSVPSSSQSSPRLSGKSDVDGASTTESGYSSNETNGELQLPINGLQALPIGGVDIDELAEFVRQDASRMERLRRRYDAGELEDHGFSRRPSVRGIKPRFGSTTDLLKQMATQLAPPTMAQPGMAGSHMTWPYRDVGDEDSQPAQRRRASQNRVVLPALQEDILYTPTSDLSPQGAPPPPSSSTAPPAITLTHTKAPRVVHVYASTGDLRAPPPPRLSGPRESPPPDLIRPGGAPVPMRALTHSLSQPLPDTSGHGLMMVPQMPTPALTDLHMASCRRPASVHGHLPPDSLVMRGVPPPPSARPHSSMSHYPNPRVPVHYHSYEDPPPTRPPYEGSHPPLAQRGSYPGTIPAPLGVHYQPQLVPPDAIGFPQPPPFGSQHSHPRPPPPVSSRDGPPFTRTLHSQVHPGPQTSSMVANPGQPHQCGPRQVRVAGGAADQACSPAWSHQQPHTHQTYAPPYPVSSHLSYTTPIVPESVMTSRPSGPPVGAPMGAPMRPIGPLIGPPIGPPIMNGGVSKLEGLRDERGVPEGASSSPRGPLDPQYPQHSSPTRDTGILHRHPPPPLNMT
ncbi:SH3 domain-containing protein C23A1.17-like [Portunus trituberculatus]|nr:SH3 domain-containing protein C23A1.17-like [Portunus trituberculatus]